ncbi:MAG: DUF1653 domain-containing protein [Ruminococcus sp.]|jgi:glycosidase|nr:DUF1653 domain-containing protein [Ruminococcus sp.]
MWINNTNIYQIYPLGFCGCETFRADFDGNTAPGRILKIIDLIPHLKNMNFNAVLFNPVFESVKHGYDTVDFYKIDGRLGTNDDFKRVCEKLHENGIRVILDGVFNHVGRDHYAFADLQKNGSGSYYKEWFAGVNFGERSPMGDNFSYEAWQNHYELVKLNLWNGDVVNHIFGAVKMWIDEWGIDGLRFDAADCLSFDFIKACHNYTKSLRDDFWLMGEIIHGDYSRWANAEMFDCVTNYQCQKGIYSSHNDKNYFEISSSLEQQKNQYRNIYMYNFADNHDVNRLTSLLKNKSDAPLCYTMIYTMYGVPAVYYGSEWGITGAKGQGAEADAPLRPSFDVLKNAEHDGALALHISKLGEIRKNLDILQYGQYERFFLNNKTLVYKRVLDNKTAYCAFNIDDKDYTFGIPSTTEFWVDCLTGERFKTFDGEVKVTLKPETSMILVEQHIYNDIFGDTIIEEKTENTEIAENIKEEIIPETIAETKAEAAQEFTIQARVSENKSISKGGVTPIGKKEGRTVKVGGTYKHFKGGTYTVLMLAKDHEDASEQVIYVKLDDGSIWVRPAEMFLEEVDDHGNIKERFQLM